MRPMRSVAAVAIVTFLLSECSKIASAGHRLQSKADQCLTYKARYEQAYRPLPLEGLNHRHPYSQHVVLIKLHHQAKPLIEDQILNLRAMALETVNAGYHFYILFEVPHDWAGTRMNLFRDLPLDLHPYIVTHSLDDTRMKYPLIVKAMDEGHPIVDAPPPVTIYLAATLFMEWFKAYDFAWVIEGDVRLVGHWGSYLNAALSIGHEAPRTEGTDIKPVPMDASQTLRDQHKYHADSMPDMISFDPYQVSDYHEMWEPTIVGMKFPVFLESGLMAWGGSRKAFDALHRYSSEGKAGYQAVFVPTIAYLEGLKLVAIDPTDQTEIYFCCTTDADRDYLNYAVNQTCLHTNLIHPVKNRGAWPEGNPKTL